MAENTLIHSPLALQAKLNGDALAFRTQHLGQAISLTYRDSAILVNEITKRFKKQGLKGGSRLACISENNIELALIYWACIEANILFCPISPKFPPNQRQQLIDELAITAYWSPESLSLEHCQYFNLVLNLKDISGCSQSEPTKVNPDSAVNIILTSGSSGSPKAAVHSLNNHIYNAKGSAKQIPLNLGDRWMLSLPLFHIGGLAILNRCAIAGACVVFTNEQQTLAEQCTSDIVTHLSLVEAQLIKLLASPQSLSSIKVLLLGGGGISQKYLAMLEQFPLQAYTSYGMTEMSSQISTAIAKQKGSGKALPYRKILIKDGVIYVRGETLFLGYLQPSSRQIKLELPLTEDGWFNTKDRGYWTQEGQLNITGRTDNMFICGGENIQPEEIEDILLSHPDIEKAIVFGETDTNFGLLPAAIIKAPHGRVQPNQLELDNYLADKLARFKRPRHYYSWPKDSQQIGLKINRSQLIAELNKN